MFFIFVATGAHFSSGYAVGFLSPGIPLLKKQYLPNLTEDQEGNLGALMLLSATLANPLAALLADSRLGRKGTIMLTAIPFVICFSLNALMPASLAAHYVARLIIGQLKLDSKLFILTELILWKENGNDFAIWRFLHFEVKGIACYATCATLTTSQLSNL